MAEEQPVAARRLGRLPVVQEGAERRDAGARTDHDDRRGWILRQAETVRLLDVDLQPVARLDAVGKEGGGDAEPLAVLDRVAHRIDRERNLARRRVGRRRDRIEPRLQRLERLDESLRVRAARREFFQRREHVERRRIAVRILAGRQRLGLLPPLAAGDVGQQLKQRVRRGRQATRRRSAPRAACAPPIAKSGRRTERRHHLLDQRRHRSAERRRRNRRRRSRARIPRRSNSRCQVSFSEPCLFSRAARQERRLCRVVARTARRRRRLRAGSPALPRPAPWRPAHAQAPRAAT